MAEKSKDLVEDMREKLEDPKARAIALVWVQRRLAEIEKELENETHISESKEVA